MSSAEAESTPPPEYTDSRLQALTRWLKKLDPTPFTLTAVSGDASFRRYFRVSRNVSSQIAMDAPPEQEACGPFITIAQALRSAGVNAPEILGQAPDQGFLLLSDFGDNQYLDALDEDTAEPLYSDALTTLLRIQSAPPPNLPPYDETLLLREMTLFSDWFLGKHLGLSAEQIPLHLPALFGQLAASALEQPQVWVLRDYHSRNLMVVEQDNPGVLDFQDAVVGPITYDLVSLLRDCYIAWPEQRVRDWALAHRQQLIRASQLDATVTDGQFLTWFDLMGVQRHLKAIGIFARLNHRDGKPGYLADIPRTLNYIIQVSRRYDELTRFSNWLEQDVRPRLETP
ncbi:MAG: phosphotransferase [Gammaproteobacteria bacterium]|nr:phosphotransferase [Gammaproteobacteria bacterium]